MPTNRTRRKRMRRERTSISSWIEWHCGILHLLDGFKDKNPWTETTSKEFWNENRDAIMAAYLEEKREAKRPFNRPDFYFEELEKKHPRKQIGIKEWTGPQTGPEPREVHRDPIYESNEDYLKRLKLTEQWETMTTANLRDAGLASRA